jgi:hypothetical protein
LEIRNKFIFQKNKQKKLRKKTFFLTAEKSLTFKSLKRTTQNSTLKCSRTKKKLKSQLATNQALTNVNKIDF